MPLPAPKDVARPLPDLLVRPPVLRALIALRHGGVEAVSPGDRCRSRCSPDSRVGRFPSFPRRRFPGASLTLTPTVPPETIQRPTRSCSRCALLAACPKRTLVHLCPLRPLPFVCPQDPQVASRFWTATMWVASTPQISIMSGKPCRLCGRQGVLRPRLRRLSGPMSSGTPRGAAPVLKVAVIVEAGALPQLVMDKRERVLLQAADSR
mmetsp:Transcript_27652/g.72909  ORF Transcript_27652/g.72909 Transcript_27652/m.72909 type:complete len:208 (+) Transcript_27652:294-917(+)